MNTPPVTSRDDPNKPWQPPAPAIRLGESKVARERRVFGKWKRLIEGIVWERQTVYEILNFDISDGNDQI